MVAKMIRPMTARLRRRRPPVIIASHSRQARRNSWRAKLVRAAELTRRPDVDAADRIGVIAAGRLIAEGTLAELRQQNGRNDTSLEDMFIALVDTEAAAA